jgi:hypothetical protein
LAQAVEKAAAGTAVPAACSGNMLDWQRQRSSVGRGPSASAAGGAATDVPISNMYSILGSQLWSVKRLI